MHPRDTPPPTTRANGVPRFDARPQSRPSVGRRPAQDWNFEDRLDTDTEWALTEGSHFLDGRGRVHEALRKIAKRLDELGVPYAVVGGMAMFRHGYQRFTEDVDILVTRDGLKIIHEKLEGRGYVPPFAGSSHLRDTELRVKIEFLRTGDFPGDGKPKPVAFQDPAAVGVEHEGVRYANLESVVEMKLASGMTNPGRVKDLGDVQEIIKVLALKAEFADQLNPFVRDKFLELWSGASFKADSEG